MIKILIAPLMAGVGTVLVVVGWRLLTMPPSTYRQASWDDSSYHDAMRWIFRTPH